MIAMWLGLCGLGLIFAVLFRAAGAMFQEEVRTRVARLPYALLRAAAIRVPRAERPDVLAEWRAELEFILAGTDGLPLTRLLRGARYSVSLLGLLLPFARIRDLIAGYWWHKESRRLRGVVWVSEYARMTVVADGICALAAALAAFQVGTGQHGHAVAAYLAASIGFPLVWLLAVELAGGYDSRVIGAGPEEFRRIGRAGISLTGSAAFAAWIAGVTVSRSYVLVLLPAATLAGVLARYWLRKRLHRLRADGRCMQRAVVAGQEPAVAALIRELRADRFHGLETVTACLAQPSGRGEVAGVPVHGGLDDVTSAVRAFAADTVVVLACPEMTGPTLRELAWDLEKSGTGLSVSPAFAGCGRTADHHPAGNRAGPAPRRSCSAKRRPPGHQDPVRPRHGSGRADPARPAARASGRGGLAARPRIRPVHAGPGRQERAPVPDLQVPYDDPGRCVARSGPGTWRDRHLA